MISWNVKIENCNARRIEDYNVLKYHIPTIKKLKKNSSTKEEFAEELRRELQWMYWSRCEYELIIEKTADKRILLSPWIGKKDFNLDVTDDTSFDWNGFFEHHVSRQIFKDRAKIDVYDQIMWRWDDFIDYVWCTRLPYERKNDKFVK